ncbi:hypothetical protein [Paenibacillus alba]|uniref:Uncharacterized protein n=1 Tax=Paenibacillus alba TaxID=1197127 RepID=A0ABU6GAE5_9BACL|nr:hypothetical protein [Paenibacillus alba]MEC0231171.1 hypothetical protein [Paenibacillus alba]
MWILTIVYDKYETGVEEFKTYGEAKEKYKQALESPSVYEKVYPGVGDIFAYEGEEGLSPSLWDVISTNSDFEMESQSHNYPLLTIGQMIECRKYIDSKWEINESQLNKPNLCDRLWDSLKKVL